MGMVYAIIKLHSETVFVVPSIIIRQNAAGKPKFYVGLIRANHLKGWDAKP